MSVPRVIAASTMLWIAATAAAFVASPRGGNTDREAVELRASVPAAKLTGLTLVLSGSQHEVQITAATPGAPNVVDIQVFVHGGGGLGFLSKPVPPVKDVVLAPHTAGGVLSLDLDHADTTLLKTEWTVTVPARFSAHVTADGGRVIMTGLEGALTAHVTAGSVRADVSASHHGPADLESVVGLVNVVLADRQFRPKGEAGPGAHWSGPAAGRGGPPITLHVTVGTAALWVR